MTRTTAGLSAMLMALSGLAYACGSAGLSSFDGASSNVPATGGGKDADAGAFGAGPTAASPADLAPVDNAVILVHAAKAQAFRLCFANELDRRPQPDSQVMPEANVVGVEVGGAVRLGPLRGVPGKVSLFEEPLIRAFYPAFGGAGQGPSCQSLLQSASLSALAVDVGQVDTDLSHGVHLLVLRGCPKDTAQSTHTLAECGAGWTPQTSNLSVKEITLPGALRPAPGTLPAQVVNLSQALESGRAGRDLLVSFGDLTTPGSTHTQIAVNPALFGEATPPQPSSLTYDSNDIGVYESVGIRVSYVPAAGAGADAGAATKVLDESLARIQKQSSPRDVPPSYYAAASNYALLLLGDANAKLADGGPDDDARRNLHFLAVPVIEPKNDGGADGGDALDGGAAPP